MKALVYHGPRQKEWETVPDPGLLSTTDVIVQVEDLWNRNVTITTGLVDTFSTPALMRMLAGQQIDAALLVTHRFGLHQMLEAYDVFGRPADTGAMKVVLTR